jgi:hypothetical protein
MNPPPPAMASASTAYVIPTNLWDRVYKFYMEKNKNKNKIQEGGGVVGVNSDGSIRTNDLMHALAVNLSLQQSPNLEFVKKADLMLKQAIDDPSLTPEERIRYLESYTRAYQDQRTGNATKAQSKVKTQAQATPATPRQPAFTPGQVTPRVRPTVLFPTTAPPPYATTSPMTPADLRKRVKSISDTLKMVRSSKRLSNDEKSTKIAMLTRGRAKHLEQLKQMK